MSRAPHSTAPGVKAMVYLDDVDASNGPFSLLLNYNARRLQPAIDPRRPTRVTRYNDSAIEYELAHGAHVHPIHAPAGMPAQARTHPPAARPTPSPTGTGAPVKSPRTTRVSKVSQYKIE